MAGQSKVLATRAMILVVSPLPKGDYTVEIAINAANLSDDYDLYIAESAGGFSRPAALGGRIIRRASGR